MSIPATVTRRKRYILIADIALGIGVLASALIAIKGWQFQLLWIPACLVGAYAVAKLAPLCGMKEKDEDLDEYFLAIRNRARRSAHNAATIALGLIVFVIMLVNAIITRAHLSGESVTDILTGLANLCACCAIGAHFVFLRSVAGAFNRDELISQQVD
ncbi:hypothetical protein QVA66_02510 [Staphylococcus chromogenes]|nr:hypothetical protein [Staphylococcus chromogenes]